MGILRNIAIVVLTISFFTFVAFFGRLPALRKTPIGWLYRLLCWQIPRGLGAVDSTLTGGRIARKSHRLGNYLFYEKNPVVLILFLFLLTASAAIFLLSAVPQLPTSLLVPVPLLVVLPYLFTYLSVTGKAHYIRRHNHSSRMLDYPFDHVLFRPQTVCRTCSLEKPARSKHCGFCGVCVAKCDHHCPWVNNCLGRGNYRYFLGLLLSIGVLEIYGAYLSYWLLRPYLKINHAHALFSRARLENLAHIFVLAVDRGGISIAGVGLLAASTASLPLGLLAYHLYLIWAGMTTNESQKWSEWKEDMRDGYVFRANMNDLRHHNQMRNIRDTYGEDESRQQNPALGGLEAQDNIIWPISSDQVLVRTNDGKPPRKQDALWTRVWDTSEVDNIYDLGWVENFLQVFRGS